MIKTDALPDNEKKEGIFPKLPEQTPSAGALAQLQ
jgi:hypothetical protein